MAGKSGKGSCWERDFCKYLSRWVQGSVKPYLFWRGRMSGGMMTMDESVGSDFAGDIYAVNQKGSFLTERFSIEAKNGYPGASLDKHLKDLKGDTILAFWKQCCGDAVKCNKRPLLAFKKKATGVWIGIDSRTARDLWKLLEGVKFVHLGWVDDDLETNGLSELYLFDMDTFFTRITADVVRNLNMIEYGD